MFEDKPLTEEQARFAAKIRRLMMVSSAATFIALFLVMGVIGYRLFNSSERGVHAQKHEFTIPLSNRSAHYFYGDCGG